LSASFGATMSGCGELPGDQGAGPAVEEETSALTSGSWATLTHPAPGNLTVCLLLTNGDVMCHEYDTNKWHRLRPDSAGKYKTGTWDNPPIPPMPNGNDNSFGCSNCTYAPRFFSSAVLKDGRVVVMGGEYVSGAQVWTNIGFIYNPLTDTWSSQLTSAFAGHNVGDTMGLNFPNGTFAVQNTAIGNTNLQTLNASTGVFTAKNPTGKLDANDEEGWYPLFDGTILTVDSSTPSSYERYNTSSNSWTHGSMPVNLTDSGSGVGTSTEVGPCAMRPDGKLACFSGNQNGQNAIFDTSNNTWSHTTSMDFPVSSGSSHFSMADGPAAALPDGNVLVMASPVTNSSPFNTPSRFFELNMSNNTLSPVNATAHASSFKSYQGRMLVLPTGEVLLTAYDQGSTQDVALYTASGGPLSSYRPIISSAPTTIKGGSTYTISGQQFNGFSQGGTYGDDSQSATNYPLVRLTNQGTNHVFFARTYNFSSMGVEKVGSTTSVSATFEAPMNLEAGATSLEVVVNGIASNKQTITAQAGPCHAPTTLGELHYVDPASGKDDLDHGGGYGSCGYKTLTYALSHSTGQVALQKATYSPSTETFPITLHGIQQILCQYLISAPATIQGKGLSKTSNENISVEFAGTNNGFFDCIVNGGGGTGYCVEVTGAGASPEHFISGADISNCGGYGIAVDQGVTNMSVDSSTLHGSLGGVSWHGSNSGQMVSNSFSGNSSDDIFCVDSEPNVNGNSNTGSVGGKPSCLNCGHCPF
jgi:hypothetical protein